MMSQLKVVISAAILLIVVSLSEGQQSSCMISALQDCFPEVMDRMRSMAGSQGSAMPVRVPFRFYTHGERNITDTCRKFDEVTTCVNGKHCSADDTDTMAMFWRQGSIAVGYLCHDHKQHFIEAQECLNSAEVRSDSGSNCDGSGHHHRRRRDACQSYEEQVHCGDEILAEHCSNDIARMVGEFNRIFLKISPNTKDCADPEFKSSATGIRQSAGLFLSAICLTVALVFY